MCHKSVCSRARFVKKPFMTNIARGNEWEDDISIVSSENVGLAVETAGLGSRFGALMLDSLLQALFIAMVFWTTMEVWRYLPRNASWVKWLESASNAFLILLLATVLLGYNFLFEWLWDGQTPGKRWLGLRVMQSDGMLAGTWPIFVRNMLRAVDFLPSFYGLGALVALINPHNRRIGDLVAGTVVARERHDATRSKILDINEAAEAFLASFEATKMLAPSQSTIAAASVAASFSNGISPMPQTGESAPVPLWLLTDEDRELLHQYVQRRDKLRGDARSRLAQSLGARLRTRLGYSTPSRAESEAFLHTILLLMQQNEQAAQSR